MSVFWKYISECDPLQAPFHGSIVQSADGMSSIYNCDTGYTLKGVKTRICQTDGSGWSGNDSSCGNIIRLLIPLKYLVVKHLFSFNL